MVDEVNVNVGTPEALEFAQGLIQGLGDSFEDFVDRIRSGSNEFFMVTTLSVMLVVAWVTIWRRL